MRETLRHRAFEGPLERAVRVFEVHYRRVPGMHWQTKWHAKKVFSGLTGRKSDVILASIGSCWLLMSRNGDIEGYVE